eukprot:8888742-Pyramimonas_sp.AAC.1
MCLLGVNFFVFGARAGLSHILAAESEVHENALAQVQRRILTQGLPSNIPTQRVVDRIPQWAVGLPCNGVPIGFRCAWFPYGFLKNWGFQSDSCTPSFQ